MSSGAVSAEPAPESGHLCCLGVCGQRATNAKLSLAIADRAYVIEMGRVVLTGTGFELLGRTEVAERYLGVGKGVRVSNAPRHEQLVGRLKQIFASAG